MAKIPYWLIRRVDVYPSEYYRMAGDGSSSTTPDPKKAMRHFEMDGAAALARALGSGWIEHLEFFEGKDPVTP